MSVYGGNLDEVSMRTRGTDSEKVLCGNRVVGSTGGTFSGNDSEAIACMRVDFPVPPSPITAILISLWLLAL